MTTRTIIAAVPLLMAGALLIPATAAAAPARAATPKALSLTLRDVEHVYGGTFTAFMTNTYKASHSRTCGADYTGGYLDIFGSAQKSSKGGGVSSIESTVFAYASARSTACASKVHGSPLVKLMAKSGATVHSAPLKGVGDSAYLYTVRTPIGSTGKHGFTLMIWLSRGTYTALITVGGVGSAPSQSNAIALAKIIDGRIQGAGR